MDIILGVIAGIIFLLYSVYFIKIIKGNPQDLELEMLRSLADWIISKGASSKYYIWIMFYISLVLEAVYFYLTLVLIQNPVINISTILIIAFEVFHLALISISLKRFFNGIYLLSQIFKWRVERASATLLFTHSFLILITLIVFKQ
jgi:hypothetical protein